MTDDELKAIEERAANTFDRHSWGHSIWADAVKDIPALVAEVSSLRLEVLRLHQEQRDLAAFDEKRIELREEENARLSSQVSALREALEGILAITDRKHVAWDKAHAALKAAAAP